jgi:hypothetical protein
MPKPEGNNPSARGQGHGRGSKKNPSSSEPRRDGSEARAESRSSAMGVEQSGFDSSQGRRVFEHLGLIPDKDTLEVWKRPPAKAAHLVYRPQLPPNDPMSLIAALEALSESSQRVPANLVPLMAVDERSVAAVVCQPTNGDEVADEVGSVVRWHLDEIPGTHQRAILDINAWTYARSVADELRSRVDARRTVYQVTERYKKEHLDRGTRPKSHVERPVQLACQNVIVGLSVFAYESGFDGLSVPAWATCEVPHVATHEGNRALGALMLCDAYATGGTMEIRFADRVPASLRRYARTVGLNIPDDAHSLTPEQSRHLFLAVTPIPKGLRRRIDRYIADGIESPERLCYTLMAQVWREIELDFLLATSTRAPSILRGGAPHGERPARMAEAETCRAALLAGTLYRRLNNLDTAGASGEARVYEDTTVGVGWEILADEGALIFDGVTDGPLPWQHAGGTAEAHKGRLIAMPRAHPGEADVKTLLALAEQLEMPVALVVPADRTDVVDCPAPVLVCPERASDIDTAIEETLLKSRLARA